ncbi:MAG: M56 family metallopeptidase [Prevotellaceae bacterium]|jgi:TonB family protein|nr:M56 family metallopeptidase [Prevotellaceae bacterium]
MGHFLSYIIQSSVCLALFYLFYRVLLSRETFHRVNRWALLGILLLSALLPLLKMTSTQPTDVGRLMLTVEEWALPSTAVAEGGTETGTKPAWAAWLLAGYLAGVAFLLVRFVWSLYTLLYMCRRGRHGQSEATEGADCLVGKGATLVVLDEAVAPFSWWRYIVVSRRDLQENGRTILAHEQAHLRGLHSLDILVADLCIVLQWFNPAVWLLKRELQDTHEYAADRDVINNQGIDATQYQLLLIRKAVGTRLYSMTNSFNHSKLKKRITMMKKEKSSRWAGLKYLYVLPLAVIVITLFARPQVTHAMAELSAAKVNDIFQTVQDTVVVKTVSAEALPARGKNATVHGDILAVRGDTVTVRANAMTVREGSVYEVVEEMPQYPGGPGALMKFLTDNIKYPEGAKKAGASGRITISFVVQPDGTLGTFNFMSKSGNKELDDEAMRVVKSMGKWTPGRHKGEAVAVMFSVPITFRLPPKDTASPKN